MLRRLRRLRVLPFPPGNHLGTLYHREPSDVWGGSREWWSWDSKIEVFSPVEVPRNMQTRLWASQKEANGWQRRPAHLHRLRDLPHDALGSLAVVQGSDGWGQHVAHLTGLSELVVMIPGGGVRFELAELGALWRLASLEVGSGALLRGELASVLRHKTRLRYLYLAGSDVDDASLDAVAAVTDLRRLELSRTNVTDAGMTALGELTHLDTLDLGRLPISNVGLVALPTLPELRSLNLDSTRVTDRGVRSLLGRVGPLETLSLRGTTVGDAGVARLGRFPTLRTLSLTDTSVTGERLEGEGMVGLKVLAMFGAPVTAGGMRRIAAMANLEVLYLTDTPLDDAGLAHLIGHPTLQHIELPHAAFSARTLLTLIESVPTLRCIGHSLTVYQGKEALQGLAARLRGLPVGRQLEPREV